jgi:hypothetical protein
MLEGGEERGSFALQDQNNTVIDPVWRRGGQFDFGDAYEDGNCNMSLSRVDEATCKIDEEENEQHKTPRPEHSSMEVHSKTHGSTPQPRQPGWGPSRRSSTSSKSATGTRHKRRKSSGMTNSPQSPTNSRHRLHSISDTSLDTSLTSVLASKKSSSTPARTNHNQVEKQYRNRLNGQFETLLEALPREDVGESGSEDGKRISKAEVLVLAKKYIARLEKEKRELQGFNKELEGRMEDLRRRWTGLGRGDLG